MKAPQLIIYSNVSEDRMLIDSRIRTFGSIFGTVKDVARQYGVSVRDFGNYRQFSAPKSHLQMFVERLHFAGVKFSDQEPS